MSMNTDLAVLEEEDERWAELERQEVFRTSDPVVVIANAAVISRELSRLVEEKKLYVSIRGRKHIRVEGWTLLGSMLRVYPVTVWSRRIDDGWEARVEARTSDGAVVGAAESECMRSEKRWKDADDYAIRSMAQTRATSKALKMPLGFVFSMAGYETTPAEEMVDEPQPAEPRPGKPTEKQKKRLLELLEELRGYDPDTDWSKWCRGYADVESFDEIDRITAELLITALEDKVDEFGPDDPPAWSQDSA
jgi:hypothetical protein